MSAGQTPAAPHDDLTAVRFGVRVDHPGTPVRDHHIVEAGKYPVRPRDIITDHRLAAALAADRANTDGTAFGHHELAYWYGAPKYVVTEPDSAALVSKQLSRGALVTERWYPADAAFVAAPQHPDRPRSSLAGSTGTGGGVAIGAMSTAAASKCEVEGIVVCLTTSCAVGCGSSRVWCWRFSRR